MIDLAQIFEDIDLIVSHAGHGITSPGFLAGIPMLIIPTNIEQLLMSRRIEGLVVGISITKERVDKDFQGVLQNVLSDNTYKEHSKIIKERYKEYDPVQKVDAIVSAVMQLPTWIS